MLVKNLVARLFLKLAAICVLTGLILTVTNILYTRGYYYRDTYGELDKMSTVPDHITMVNLGTRHGLASFIYPDDGVVRYNLALSGEDIYHDFATLKQFTKNLEKGCIVALPISYFSFGKSTDEPSQKRYYLYLDREYIKDFTYETLINAKYLPVLRSGEFIIKDLINDRELDVADQLTDNEETVNGEAELTADGDSEYTAEERREMDKEITQHAVSRAESWRAGYMTAGRIFIKENVALLTEMVDYCYEHGFRPLLVTTPIYYSLNERFGEEELDTCFVKPMQEVIDATGVPYLDLSHDPQFTHTPEYYSNSDHLNETGAAAFYERYTEFLDEIGYTE